MHLKPLALAATAAAFLVVPDTTNIDIDREDAFSALPIADSAVMPFEIPATAVGQDIKIPCAQCMGEDTSIELSVAIEDGSRLTLNGVEMYPEPDLTRENLVAMVTSTDDTGSREQRLGYGLIVRLQGRDQEQQMDLISVEMRVLEVGSRFVDDMPIVKVGVISATTGEILIGSVNLHEVPADIRCETMWCRTKNLISDLTKGFRRPAGCGGRHRPFAIAIDEDSEIKDFMAEHAGEMAEPGYHHDTHHHEHPHHYHDGQYTQRPHWHKLLRGVVSHIFLPVLMGVAAGVGIAMISVFICGLAARLTTLITGRRDENAWICSIRRVSIPAAAFVDDEEKLGLMEEGDVPPQYPAEKI